MDPLRQRLIRRRASGTVPEARSDRSRDRHGAPRRCSPGAPLSPHAPFAPELAAHAGFNTPVAPSLAALRGRVVVLHAFQMLCPGCVAHGLPQAQRVAATFDPAAVAVLGLHSVFEHHAAMTPVALEAFLHEYRIGFPVAVDAPASEGPIPRTMAAFGLRGTPSLVLIDRAGRIRLHRFGRVDDLALGAATQALVDERPGVRRRANERRNDRRGGLRGRGLRAAGSDARAAVT